MMLIDTYCHLNDPAFRDTLPEVIAQAANVGVYRFIVPAYDLESLGRTAELPFSFPGVIFSALGIHPWHVTKKWVMRKFSPLSGGTRPRQSAKSASISRLKCPPREIQIKSLIRQLEWAGELGLPVTIHCRKAYDVLYQILLDQGGKIRGALHSFSGSKEMMFNFIELGFYIAFSGSVTRKRPESITRMRRPRLSNGSFSKWMRHR